MGQPTRFPRSSEAESAAVSRSAVVALRVVLLLAAAAALAAALVIARRGGEGESDKRYACPMHPEVKAAQPGECPICRMALEPIARGAGASPRPGMGGMIDTAAVDNIRKHKILDFVRMRSLLLNVRELRGPAWVGGDGTITGVFYDDQIAALAVDEPGTFTLTQSPGITVAVRRIADPVVRWDRSTSQVRFRVEPGAARAAAPPRSGQIGWVELERKRRDVLTVPASAIIQSPEGPYVLAALGGGRYEKRPIEIGETFLKQGFAVVLSGLRNQERVVGRATFFVDADRRLGAPTGQAGIAGMVDQ